MSVDTKVFVVVREEQKLEVCRAVQKAVKKLVIGIVKDATAGTTGSKWRSWQAKELSKSTGNHFTTGVVVRSTDMETFQLLFGVGDEQPRTLWMFTKCGGDENKFLNGDEQAVWFSIGCWGSNKLIMNTVIEAVKPFGRTYVDWNDCDAVDYEEVV